MYAVGRHSTFPRAASACRPLDSGASALAQSSVSRRNNTSSRQQSAGRQAAAIPVDDDADEVDVEMAAALAASMEDQRAGTTDRGRFAALDDTIEVDEDDHVVRTGRVERTGAACLLSHGLREQAAAAPAAAAAAAGPSPQEVMDASRSRLPPEPVQGGVRVAVKLPDGRRLMRAFSPDTPVTVLRDLVLSEVCPGQLDLSPDPRRFVQPTRGSRLSAGGGGGRWQALLAQAATAWGPPAGPQLPGVRGGCPAQRIHAHRQLARRYISSL